MAKKNLVGKLTPEIFRRERMDIRDSDIFFEENGIKKNNYKSAHISASVAGNGRIYDVEIELAKSAIKEGYEYVTNMDYLNLREATAIAARGWKQNA